MFSRLLTNVIAPPAADGETLGLIETEGETDNEGLTEGLTETEGLTDGEMLGLKLTLGETDGLSETEGETDGLKLGDVEEPLPREISNDPVPLSLSVISKGIKQQPSTRF